MIHPDKRFRIADCDGDLRGGFPTAASAWRSVGASDRQRLGGFAPYTVVELVDCPRPVPPRPELCINGTVLSWTDHLYRETPGGLYSTTSSSVFSSACSAAARLSGGDVDSDVILLIQLRADSDAWDAKYTEPVPPTGPDHV